MIENLRKYTGLIIVLFVLVIIGFIFLDSSSIRASRGGAPILKVDGRNYTDKEYTNLGSASYELTQSLAQSGDFQLYTFLFSLAGNATTQEQAMENFFVNRILIRSAKEEFGIYPGEKEIDTFIRQLRAFTGPDGAFSQEAYRNFIEKGIGRLGLTEGDVRELASDIITQRKLTEILGSGLSGDRDILSKSIAIESQTIGANVALIDKAPIEEKIEPTEEEIKTYWETVQDAFKTEEKRRFTYFLATPQTPDEPEEIPALADDATEEQKAEYEEKVADRAAIIEENQRTARLEAGKQADQFFDELMGENAASFEELAQKQGWEIKNTELFTLPEAPPELQMPLRGSSTQSNVAAELFKMKVTPDPLSKYSPFLTVGENEWIMARLEETVESRTKTYEEARNEARARLIAELSDAELKKVADEAIEKIKASLAEGKTFAEASKAAGIEKDPVNLPDVDASSQLDTTKAPSNLFDAAKYTAAGELADPVIQSDRAFVIHVETREVEEDPNAQVRLDGRMDQAADSNRNSAFMSWLSAKSEAADVQQLYRQ